VRKSNTTKVFAHQEVDSKKKAFESSTTIYDDVDEAVAAAKAEAEGNNVAPSSIMVSMVDGYVTGDGMIHSALGVTAAPRKKADADEAVAEEDAAPEEPVEDEKPKTTRGSQTKAKVEKADDEKTKEDDSADE
jgi:hypothetical protein